MKGRYWVATILLLLLLTLLGGGIASAQDPPTVTTNAASGVTTDSATLNGSLTSLGNASSVDVSFEWGLTTGYGSETTPQTMTATGAFNDSIGGLDPGTTYHFRAKAVGNGTAFGDDVTFTTGTTPPTVTTNAASGVTTDSATLNGSLTSLGTAGAVDVSFEWGLTTGYGNETTPQTMTATGAFNDSISSLDPGTTYHFRAKAVGNGTAFGDDVTFTTGTTPPTVTTSAASGVTADSATLNGSLTSLGTAGSVDVSFEWGLTTGYGNETTPQTMTATGAFNDSISSLDPGTTYHFRAKAVDNGTAFGDDVTFTTGTTPPTVTTNAASGVTADSATLNGSLTSLGTAGSVDVSFEWGLTTSYGNETTPQTMTATGAFNDSISSLDPATTYHFRAKAVGNGTTFGDDVTFTTGTTPTDTSVDISPASQTVSALQVFTVDVVVDPAVPIAGVALVLSFDPSLLTANNVVEGGLLNQNGAPTFFAPGIIDNVAGTIGVAGVISLANTTVSSAGTFATITFTAKTTEGTSPLDLPNVIVGDAAGAPVAIVVTDGSVTIEISVVSLSGWGWCTDYGQIVKATLDSYVTMVERSHAARSFSLHVVGNITLHLPGGPDEVIALDMYGSRVRSLFYLRQEVPGKSVSFEGTWIDAEGSGYYILTEGMIALPNPEGEALKTARICFLLLRTPDVEVQLGELGSFVDDIESMLTRFIRFIDNLLDSLIGTGLGEILSAILVKIATLLAALRALGTPYIS